MRQTVSDEVKNKVGKNCCNCGASENIEYHHIVPLFLGGKDVITNIVPLCHQCHKAAHCGRHVSHYAISSNGGRKTKAIGDKAETVFEAYLNGKVGNRKACEMLGYADGSQIKSVKAFKQFIRDKGISKVRNLIDVVGTNRLNGLADGYCVGEIEYSDGHKENIYYKDIGTNDIDYVRRKPHETVKIFDSKAV